MNVQDANGTPVLDNENVGDGVGVHEYDGLACKHPRLDRLGVEIDGELAGALLLGDSLRREAPRAIRALPGHRGATPIVALTANTLAEQKAEYFAAGMDDCMAKPINIVELTHMVLSGTSSDWRRSGPPLIAAVA